MVNTQPLAAKWIARIRAQFGFNRETPAQEALRHEERLASYERRTKLARQFLSEMNTNQQKASANHD